MENRKTRLRERIGFKIFSGVCAAVFLSIFIISSIMMVLCLKNDVYFDSGRTFRKTCTINNVIGSEFLFSNIFTRTGPVELNYVDKIKDPEAIDKAFEEIFPNGSNLDFRVLTPDGGEFYSTSKGCERYERLMTSTIASVPTSKRSSLQAEYSSFDKALDGVINYCNMNFEGKVCVTPEYSSVGWSDWGTIEIMTVDSEGTVTPTENYDAVRTFDNFLQAYYEIGEENASIVFGQNGQLFLRDGDELKLSVAVPQTVFSDVANILDYLRNASASQDVEPITLRYTVEGMYDARSEMLSCPVEVYLKPQMAVLDRIYFNVRSTQLISRYSALFPAAALLSLIMTVFFSVVICITSGRKKGSDEPKISLFDRIPFEVFIALICQAAYYVYIFYIYVVYRNLLTDLYGARLLDLAIYFSVPFAMSAICVITLFTLSARIKTGMFFKTTAVGMVLMLVWFVLKLFVRIFKGIRITWKALIITAVVFMLNLILLFSVENNHIETEVYIALLFAVHAQLAVLLALWSLGFSHLMEYSAKISSGESDPKLNKTGLFGDLKTAADGLENLGESVQKAVDERMRSELLKTELITNVSHDLKTPLTSIVNYVDILSKDDIADEQAKEHIAIIKRQSLRMKKLIEDLVEVSKASSGNVNVNAELTDVNLLMSQTSAEYTERFRDCGLSPVIDIPEKKMTAYLDGRLMWRVIDNLCGNICKYALSGTRAYISEEDAKDSIILSFKNVSREYLNISGADLTERFVRGDSSRNTEGSGLGLSIAKSLCDLQNVVFNISVDGDLFKAELIIPKAGESVPETDAPELAAELDSPEQSAPELCDKPIEQGSDDNG